MDAFSAIWTDGTLRLSGEVDITVQDELLTVFRGGLGASEVIVDLSDVTFIDGTGIRMLLTIAQEAGRRVTLRSPRAHVRRVLGLTRVADSGSLVVD